MCNKLQEVLKKTNIDNKAQGKVYNAIADDMDVITGKIDLNNTRISNVETTVNSIKDTVNGISDKLKKIENKLYEDKIEEKAYIFETIHLLAKNKWFWIIIITITMLAGTGIITILDKSAQIKEVARSIRGV